MRSDLRWLVVLSGNLAFLWLVSQLNHHLAAFSFGPLRGPLHVFLLGLPLAFCTLRLRLRYGLAVIIPTTLAAEAGLPLPHGALLLPSVALLCLGAATRGNFNRFDPASSLIAVLVANLALMVALSIATGAVDSRADAWRVITDILVSQSAAFALGGWFFAWQLALLRFFGFDLETELREPA